MALPMHLGLAGSAAAGLGLGVAPGQAVFLDDIGSNLKTARALGMQTLKVTDADAALAELEAILGFPLGD